MRTSIVLFLLSLLFLDANSQTLHAIMVSDVEDPKLGGVSLRDEAKILDILTTAEWGTGLKLRPVFLSRAKFTTTSVRETLDELPVGPRDVVFFYYTGLGYYPNAGDRFPTFKMKESFLQPFFAFFNFRLPLSLEEVGDILQEKGARLNVVMADCRDTLQPPFYVDWNPELGTSVEEDLRKVFLKKLFLGSCGLVKVASARRGQKVWADASGKPAGSLYTEKFFRNFEWMLDPPKWEGNIEPTAKFTGVRQANWQQVTEFDSVRPPEGRVYLKDNPDLNDEYEGNYDSSMYYYPDKWREYRRTVVQQSIVETGTCTAAQRRLTTTYASYRHSATANEIGEFLKLYLCPYGPERAYLCNKDFAELYRKVSPAFHKNATIQLIRKNKYPDSSPQARSTIEKISVKDFLKHFKDAPSKIKSVLVDASSVKRNPNWEYITSLTIIEYYDEL